MKQKLAGLLSNSRSRMILTVVIVAVIVTITIGVGSTLAANDQEKKTLAISEKAAKEIAMNKTDGGILESFKMEFDDGKKIFEVDIVKGDYKYDIKIDGGTGEIIAFDQEKIKMAAAAPKEETPTSDGSGSGQQVTDADSNSSSSNSNSGGSSSSGSTNSGTKSSSDSGSSYIGKTKAKNIALNKTGGGSVVHCYLDYDDGRAEYDVKIFNGKYEYELEICAKTGRILDYDKELQDKYEHDDDDDHYDDHDDQYDD